MALGMAVLNQKEGHYLLGMLLAINFMTDIGAYTVGSGLGRHKLAPRISPKKTVEGAAGGFLFAILAAVICQGILYLMHNPLFTNGEVVLLGALFGITGQVGDLVESGLKRDAGVKDSGQILGGHGGILDRMDGLIFSLPLFYLYLSFFPR